MNSPGIEDYQALTDSMSHLLYDRVAAATPIEVLSQHDKLLQVVEADDGERFVTRSYTPEAIEDIEAIYRVDFRTAWEEMHAAFEGVGIGIVPSRLIETDGDHPFIIVSEYLEDGQPLSSAPLETKTAVAEGLAKLLTTDGGYIPSPEMIREDMFMVVERDGKTKALLVDVDPLMARAHRIQKDDGNSGFYVAKLAELAWDNWCDEGERQAVTSTLVRALGDYALGNFEFGGRTSSAFMDLHLMSNGVDNRSAHVGKVLRQTGSTLP